MTVFDVLPSSLVTNTLAGPDCVVPTVGIWYTRRVSDAWVGQMRLSGMNSLITLTPAVGLPGQPVRLMLNPDPRSTTWVDVGPTGPWLGRMVVITGLVLPPVADTPVVNVTVTPFD